MNENAGRMSGAVALETADNQSFQNSSAALSRSIAMDLHTFTTELKRRNVYKVAAA